MVIAQRAHEFGHARLFRGWLDGQQEDPATAGQTGFEWRYWKRLNREASRAWAQPVWATSTAFSADGEWFAADSTEQTVTIRRVGDGEIVRVFKGQTRIFSVSLSPDRR